MMRCVLIAALSMACAAAQFVTPNPSVMPAWLVPYPGVSAENRRTGNSVESSYTVAVAPHDVLAHFRRLFAIRRPAVSARPHGFGFSHSRGSAGVRPGYIHPASRSGHDRESNLLAPIGSQRADD